jgi:predicted DNA-binding transcriptional regulator AlpA
MTDPDIDDLLGPDPAKISAPAVYDLREVHGGVSLSWLAQVFKMDRLSRSEIYKRIQAGRFPSPIKLAPKVAAWSSTKIRQWQIEQELIGWSSNPAR